MLEKSERLDDPYVVASNRVYAIGTQRGAFPDMGRHQPGEMGGVWDHPIKLLDGYWFAITRPAHGEPPVWLVQAERFRSQPGYVEFLYRVDDLEITRREFAPDNVEGLVVELRLCNPGRRTHRLTVTFLARTDLHPAWRGESLGLTDAPDEASYDPHLHAFIAQDGANPWYVLFGSDREPTTHAAGRDLWGPEQTAGQGISGQLTYALEINLGETVLFSFFIAGSSRSIEEAAATYHHLRENRSALLHTKQTLYQGIASTSKLSSPDPVLDTAFLWAKYGFQMLARKIPGLGEGVGAGFPEYPWWFGCDSAYAIPAIVATGFFDLAKETLRLLARVSQRTNGNGRIVHEVTTNGVVQNPGNLVETPLFVRALYHTYRWTGDGDLLRELYPLCKQGLLDYVLGESDPDGDLCGSGRSIIESWEMHWGLEPLDVAAYTWEALNFLAELAPDVGDKAAVPMYQEKAGQLRETINREWWLEEEDLYGDLRASLDQVEAMIGDLGARHPRHPRFQALHEILEPQVRDRCRVSDDPACRTRDCLWLLKHWIVATPLEVGLADPEKAQRALACLESPEFSEEWGLCLNAHWDRTVMTLSTGVLAVAEARYGKVEQALDYARRIARTLYCRFPGGMSEASPDRWCFLQAWSGYGVIWPIVSGLLGLRPNAVARRIVLLPRLPEGWDNLTLSGVRIGQAVFDFTVQREGNALRVMVHTTDHTYQVAVEAE